MTVRVESLYIFATTLFPNVELLPNFEKATINNFTLLFDKWVAKTCILKTVIEYENVMGSDAKQTLQEI